MKCTPIFSPEDADLAALSWVTDKEGYARRSLHIKPLYQYAHRTVAARMFGALTRAQLVDHQNRLRLDNQRGNLRITDAAGNSQNRRGEYRGTTFHKCGKWQSTVGHKGKTHYLGLFTDRAQAARAAADKRRALGFLGSLDQLSTTKPQIPNK